MDASQHNKRATPRFRQLCTRPCDTAELRRRVRHGVFRRLALHSSNGYLPRVAGAHARCGSAQQLRVGYGEVALGDVAATRQGWLALSPHATNTQHSTAPTPYTYRSVDDDPYVTVSLWLASSD